MKKLLAILLAAMIAASVAVVPVSAVEVSDNTIIANLEQAGTDGP